MQLLSLLKGNPLMKVKIDGKRINLKQSDVIGQGGEGVVYRLSDKAIKIYHTPDKNRSIKLAAFVQNRWQLPSDKIIMPQDIVTDERGQTIGYIMDYLGTGYNEVAGLSNKKFRNSLQVSPADITKLFLDGGHTLMDIHQNRMVVGDLNDGNELFRSHDMVFIDVDAYQFDKYLCTVATENFVAPELYGIDFSRSQVFNSDTDWYSFAVMYFKSLLMVHPYGGIHTDMPRLTQRATAKVTVLDSGVIYPKIALDPSILTPDMKDVFDTYFKKGWRGPFPLAILSNFYTHLSGIRLPFTQSFVVQAKHLSVSDGIDASELIRTNGQIVYHKLVGDTFYVIANEGEYYVLYKYNQSYGEQKKVILKTDEARDVRFELFSSYLCVVIPQSDEDILLIFDISGDSIDYIEKTTADKFALTGKSVTRSNGAYLYRIKASTLLKVAVINGMLIETAIKAVNPKQTWFSVDREDQSDNPSMFGLYQVIDKQLYWCQFDGMNYDVSLSSLRDGETLRDISARFSSQGAMIRRQTEYKGKMYHYIDQIDKQGSVVNSIAARLQDDIKLGIHGIAYSTGVALHPTDDGIVSENLSNATQKTFSNTKRYLASSFSLYRYRQGVAVIADEQVIYLKLL